MLEEMADLAGAEIIRAAGEVKDVKRGELKAKREAWKRSKLVKRVSDATKLDTVPEVSTPPQSPELVTLEGAFTGLGGLGAASDPSEASADAPESVSDGPSEELGITDSKPTFAKGRKGVHAPQPRLPDDIKAVFDLSTQLVGESLDFDFCCTFLVFLRRLTVTLTPLFVASQTLFQSTCPPPPQPPPASLPTVLYDSCPLTTSRYLHHCLTWTFTSKPSLRTSLVSASSFQRGLS